MNTSGTNSPLSPRRGDGGEAHNVFVYCEIEQTTVAEVSQELLTKGRKLASELGVELHAVVAGTGIKGSMIIIGTEAATVQWGSA